MPVADLSQSVSNVAQRYAVSLFELAKEDDSIDAVGADIDRVEALLNESDDFRRLVMSPVFSADEQLKAVTAILAKAEIGGYVANFVKLVAKNRRLFVLPGMISAYRGEVAAYRGQATAEVTVAHALSDEQQQELKTALKDVTGKDVSLQITEDASLLGGMIVKVGSRQIDTSLRTKLSKLKLSLKEVG
ncbi:F0F1 ATP synthase subunit delta [Martelella sp. AD-3]|uniref:F0F1 ATP synthase subunit delta n=1 Tax=Martelella sp. AD-3 TaxID=686597 RepID=UPI0004636CB8|nr:F0F1 ATP synthase subunit delta [Martelella sp. AD-3]AMM83658.1 ATP synthase F0F1 subunit delta [Martelella sp. AD-3]